MAEFIIRPHGRLHDWIADEQGYFREEGLSYRLVGDEERENRPKEVDPATGVLREVRSGAYEMYQQGGGAKGDTHYSRASFESTQRWIHERDIFETVGASAYEAAVIT
jgi:hypothetical protein